MAPRSLTPEHKAAMQAGRIKAREVAAGKISDGDDTDTVTNAEVSRRNTRDLVASGLKKEARVTIKDGVGKRQKLGGKTGEVVGMNWADGEVQVKLDGESRMAWFLVGELVKA